MKSEYVALSLIGVFLVAAVLTWRKFRAVDRQFAKMQQQINEMRWMESRLFLMEVNTKRGADGTGDLSQKSMLGGAAVDEDPLSA